MVGEHCIFDRDAVLKDTVGTEHLPDILEEFGEFEDMYDIDHLEDTTDEEAALLERQEIRDIQNPMLTMMRDARVEEEMEISIEMLSIDDPEDEQTIESVYSFERVQELYTGVTDLSEFQEFYEVYIRDFMELEVNRPSRINFVKQLNLTWFNLPTPSNKRAFN